MFILVRKKVLYARNRSNGVEDVLVNLELHLMINLSKESQLWDFQSQLKISSNLSELVTGFVHAFQSSQRKYIPYSAYFQNIYLKLSQ
jgi:hypothetical protein